MCSGSACNSQWAAKVFIRALWWKLPLLVLRPWQRLTNVNLEAHRSGIAYNPPPALQTRHFLLLHQIQPQIQQEIRVQTALCCASGRPDAGKEGQHNEPYCVECRFPPKESYSETCLWPGMRSCTLKLNNTYFLEDRISDDLSLPQFQGRDVSIFHSLLCFTRSTTQNWALQVILDDPAVPAFPFNPFFHPFKQLSYYEVPHVTLSYCTQLPSTLGYSPGDFTDIQWMWLPDKPTIKPLGYLNSPHQDVSVPEPLTAALVQQFHLKQGCWKANPFRWDARMCWGCPCYSFRNQDPLCNHTYNETWGGLTFACCRLHHTLSSERHAALHRTRNSHCKL